MFYCFINLDMALSHVLVNLLCLHQRGGASGQFETLCGLSGFSDMILGPPPHLPVSTMSTIWFSVRFKLPPPKLSTVIRWYYSIVK